VVLVFVLFVLFYFSKMDPLVFDGFYKLSE